jgi:agmatinase
MPIIDPQQRWQEVGVAIKPDHAGLLTYAALPYAHAADDLDGVDVAIVGAPMEELQSDRGGTRFGPRAIRASGHPPFWHLSAHIDWAHELRVVDFGDAPTVPADAERSHRNIEATVADVVRAGAVPLVLGGDHSISAPNLRACAAAHGTVGLIHFDAHTDTAPQIYGVLMSHGSVMYRLVEEGVIDPRRYVQIGLRGHRPGERDFAWLRERGVTSLFMDDIASKGLDEILRTTSSVIGDGPVFMSVDIDVLDPAFAPGVSSPEPGGMSAHDLLYACRVLATCHQLVGADVVEVLPTGGFATPDITATAADRVVREILTGIALYRRERGRVMASTTSS